MGRGGYVGEGGEGGFGGFFGVLNGSFCATWESGVSCNLSAVSKANILPMECATKIIGAEGAELSD